MPSVIPTIRLDVFEGPYDLLLELARDKKIDITTISLSKVTEDFIQYIQQDVIDPRVQGDFLIVASTLLLLKTRGLLPQFTDEEQEELSGLTDHLKMYQRYREKAEDMQRVWGRKRLLPAGFLPPTHTNIQPTNFPDVAAADMAFAMKSALAKLPKPIRPRAHLTSHGRSLQECVVLFQERVLKLKELVFQEQVQGVSKQETAVSFLAVLELAKQREVELDQKTHFDALIIRKSLS